MTSTCSLTRFALTMVVAAAALVPVHAVTIDWVTVGDPGNTADTTGSPNPAGAVVDLFKIAKYETTNQQYADFLNAVASTDTYSLYSLSMGSNVRGGITRTGSSGSYSYAVRTNMGNKPVNFVTWFDAARMANWLHNGQGSGSTETGAYTLNGATSGTAPARNPGARVYIPTEDQWYKAAYYKGGGSNAGYWDYATQSDSAPGSVTATSTGDGSAGPTGNFANFNVSAAWNLLEENVTTVGTNGGASAYGAFDMSGNVYEWNDLTGAAGTRRGSRGGEYGSADSELSSGAGGRLTPFPTLESAGQGFRLVAVPEPSTYAMALAGLACGGYVVVRRRRTS